MNFIIHSSEFFGAKFESSTHYIHMQKKQAICLQVTD